MKINQNIPKIIKEIGHVLDIWLPGWMQYNHTPGLSIGISYKGKLVYKNAFGYADMEKKKKALPTTLYRIASISKTCTAVAILQLAEQKKLKLDDKLSKYLPWLEPKSEIKKTTIRQVLSHGGKFVRDGETHHWDNDKFPTFKELKRSSKHPALVKNKANFKYSNFAYALLGEVIRQASGMSYEEYVEKNILKELGMSNTFPDLTKKAMPHLAIGYSRFIPNKKREKFRHMSTHAYKSAVGFISNVVDLIKFIKTFSLKKSIISKRSLRLMINSARKTGEEKNTYGLGLNILKLKNKIIMGHTGGFPGFVTAMQFDSKNDIGIVVLTNSIGNLNFRGIFEMIYTVMDNQKIYGFKRSKNYSRFEGIYSGRWGDRVVAKISDTLISFDVENNPPLKQNNILRQKSNNSFIIEGGSNFGYVYEVATFDIRNGRAKTLWWGVSRLSRVSK